jgi:hypothetical protein
MAIRDAGNLEPFLRGRLLLQGKLDVAAYIREINQNAREGLDRHMKDALQSEEAERAYARIFEGVPSSAFRIERAYQAARDSDSYGTVEEGKRGMQYGGRPVASLLTMTSRSSRRRSRNNLWRVNLAVTRALDLALPTGSQRGKHERA